MNAFIDPPSPFAPLHEWDAFLASLKRIKEPDADVRAMIKDAEKQIAEKSASL